MIIIFFQRFQVQFSNFLCEYLLSNVGIETPLINLEHGKFGLKKIQ